MPHSRVRFALLLTSGYVLLVGVGVLRHEMWMDEMQAWLLARDADTLSALWANTRYEGHPLLWHFGLFLLSRLTSSPSVMQAYQVCIAALGVFLVAYASPFRRLHVVLLSCSYFLLFEYGVISRAYSLGVTLTFASLAHALSRRPRPLVLALLLALLANTSALGLLVAGSLALAVLTREVGAAQGKPSSRRSWMQRAGAVLVLGAGFAVAAVSMLPPPDAMFIPQNEHSLALGQFNRPMLAVLRSYVPLPRLDSLSVWNTNWLVDALDWPQLSHVLAAVLLVVGLVALLPFPAAAVLYVTGTGVLLGFMGVGLGGSMRHHGHLALVLVSAAWWAGRSHRSDAPARLLRGLHLRARPAWARVARWCTSPLVVRGVLLAWSSAAVAVLFVWQGLSLLGALLVLVLGAVWLYDNALLPDGALRVGRWVASGWRGGLQLLVLTGLSVQAASGLLMFGLDLALPFSSGKALARSVAEHRGTEPVFVADTTMHNFAGPVLAGYLGTRVVYLQGHQQREGSFLVWDFTRKNMQADEAMLRHLARLLPSPRDRALLVADHPLPLAGAPLQVKELARFGDSIIPDEKKGFFIYRATGASVSRPREL